LQESGILAAPRSGILPSKIDAALTTSGIHAARRSGILPSMVAGGFKTGPLSQPQPMPPVAPALPRPGPRPGDVALSVLSRPRFAPRGSVVAVAPTPDRWPVRGCAPGLCVAPITARSVAWEASSSTARGTTQQNGSYATTLCAPTHSRMSRENSPLTFPPCALGYFRGSLVNALPVDRASCPRFSPPEKLASLLAGWPTGPARSGSSRGQEQDWPG
jgi:hypothetical protein